MKTEKKENKLWAKIKELKVCSKIHIFIIISSLLIAIGLAVGTICHFCANGFFNYGGEFQSYKSVTVTYAVAEWQESDVKKVCDKALGGFNAYEFSASEDNVQQTGGELVYKFSKNTDSAKLQSAVDKIVAELNKDNESGLNNAYVHEGVVKEGGSRAITYASIAVASAAAFQFLYFVVRYKLRAAYSALLANVHNLGVFVALAAITRMPVGTEMIAIGAAVVVLTMILTCVLFDRTRKNFANEKYQKTERLEVVDISASEIRLTTLISLCTLAAAIVVFGVFAAIAQLWAGALAPFGLALLGIIACLYGTLFFTPAVHGAIDGASEKVKKALANKKKNKAVKEGTSNTKSEKAAKKTV